MPKIPTINPKKRDFNSVRVRPYKESAWGGPTVEGVSQSMMGAYLQCKERFRVTHIDGLRPIPELSIALEFGNMWHLCEEKFANHEDWEDELREYVVHLELKYPKDQKAINQIYSACMVEFPIYVEYWSTHEDVLKRTPVLQEKVFDIPLTLPSLRVARLRGKWDSIDLIGSNELYLQENKSKTSIQIYKIQNQLKYDLQTMTYLIAMEEALKNTGTLPGVAVGKLPKGVKLAGVRYNVIMRALSGGVGSIKQRKKSKNKPAESDVEFYERLGSAIRNHQEDYFRRWKVEVTKEDRNTFRYETLEPLLENLLDDYEWWDWCKKHKCYVYDGERRAIEFPEHVPRHFRLPYGIYSVVLEGGYTRLDDYINTGSILNLTNSNIFFTELQ